MHHSDPHAVLGAGAAPDLALSVRALHGHYGPSHVLHGMAFDVPRGQVITLLGRNGAGKTTTLRALMGLLAKRSGSVLVNGQQTIGLPPEKIAPLGIAYCPEDRGILASLSVQENLLLPPVLNPGGLSTQEVLELFPRLRERAGSPGTKLSGGEQQMLAIARILRTGARLLLLDEPTEGLAPVIVEHIGEVLAGLKQRGYTLVLVEQNLEFAMALADTHYVVEHGQVVDAFSNDALLADAAPLQTYLGSEAMNDVLFGIPLPALAAQLTLGLINGAFYAMLSLGLTVIFGMLRLINFTHGAQFTLGAFGAWMAVQYLGIPYWGALVLVPMAAALLGVVLERLLLRRVYRMDELFQLLLTFGLALVIEGLLSVAYGSSGLPYDNPMPGGIDLGFMFLPYYRAWIILASLGVCLATWFLIERTRLGANLRAATEAPQLVRSFGINVPRMITLTYGFGVALAALAGVLAAPMDQVKPAMGSSLIITVFAVVVIGGMGSILGSMVIGFALGLLEALAKVYYPPASNMVIFLIMTLVIMVRPTGLFGRAV